MKYSASVRSEIQPTPEQEAFIYRRTAGFLDRIGMTQPLQHLLAEAYFQGMKDAAEGMRHRLEGQPPTPPKGETKC